MVGDCMQIIIMLSPHVQLPLYEYILVTTAKVWGRPGVKGIVSVY